MTKTLIKSRYMRHNLKNSNVIKNINSEKKTSLPPELQVFKDKLLSGNGFLVYK